MRAALESRGPAAKLAVGLALILALGAAASYAAVRPGSGHGGERRAPGTAGGSPTLPVAPIGSAGLRIVGHPPTISTRTTARFRIAAAGEPTLRCRLDRRAAKPCAASVVYSGLGTGPHNFLVQAQRPGRASARAGFAWTVLEPQPFTVASQPGAVGPLFPGATPSPVPLVISNPNAVAITVTALTVTATGGGTGCDPGPNLAIETPDLGRGQLRIPAHGTVSLPSAGVAAPTIGLRNLEVPQDACQGADFELAFSGSAGS